MKAKVTILSVAIVIFASLFIVLSCENDKNSAEDSEDDSIQEGCSPNVKCDQPDEVLKKQTDNEGSASFQCSDGTQVDVVVFEDGSGNPIPDVEVILIRDGDYLLIRGNHENYYPHIVWGNKSEFETKGLGVAHSLVKLSLDAADWYNEVSIDPPEEKVSLFEKCLCLDKARYKKRVTLYLDGLGLGIGVIAAIFSGGGSEPLLEIAGFAMESLVSEYMSGVVADETWKGYDADEKFWSCESLIMPYVYVDTSESCGSSGGQDDDSDDETNNDHCPSDMYEADPFSVSSEWVCSMSCEAGAYDDGIEWDFYYDDTSEDCICCFGD